MGIEIAGLHTHNFLVRLQRVTLSVTLSDTLHLLPPWSRSPMSSWRCCSPCTHLCYQQNWSLLLSPYWFFIGLNETYWPGTSSAARLIGHIPNKTRDVLHWLPVTQRISYWISAFVLRLVGL